MLGGPCADLAEGIRPIEDAFELVICFNEYKGR